MKGGSSSRLFYKYSMKKFSTILLEGFDNGIEFGEERQINDYQLLLPVIVDGKEMTEDEINFIIEPHEVNGETLYQPHIHIIDRLRHQGIGYRIYLAFLHEFGNLYSSHWCRTNDKEIPAIYDKLSREPGIRVVKTKDYYYAYLENQD